MAEIKKNYLHERNKHLKTKAELTTANRLNKDLENKLHALEIELKAWEDKWTLLQKGALIWTENDGYISSAVNIPNDFNHSYPRELPADINNQCYQMIDNEPVLDKVKYRKLRGGL